jgi:hypothetical protein
MKDTDIYPALFQEYSSFFKCQGDFFQTLYSVVEILSKSFENNLSNTVLSIEDLCEQLIYDLANEKAHDFSRGMKVSHTVPLVITY